MQKPPRSGHWPWRPRPRSRRIGLDKDLAKAIARLEFGRFYTDEAREREVARSLARAKARREPPPDATPPEPVKQNNGSPTKCASAGKPASRSQLSPRERRTERAEAVARIAAAAKLREEKDGR